MKRSFEVATASSDANMAKNQTITDTASSSKDPHLALFSKILTPLVNSAVLTTPEVGRLVLMTSKELQSSAFLDVSNEQPEREEYFWKRVCIWHWNESFVSRLETTRSSKQFEAWFRADYRWKQVCISHWNKQDVEELQAAVHMTFEDCYRKFGPKEQSIEPPFYPRREELLNVATDLPFAGARPLQYSPEDYVVVVCLMDMNNQNLCKAIKGQAIPHFFSNGCDEFSFDQKIAVEQTEEWIDFHGDEPHGLYIVRCPDGQTLSFESFVSGSKVCITTASGGEVVAGIQEARDVLPDRDYAKALFLHASHLYRFTHLYFVLELSDFRDGRAPNTFEAHGVGLHIRWGLSDDQNRTGNLRATDESIVEFTGGLTAAHFIEAIMDP